MILTGILCVLLGVLIGAPIGHRAGMREAYRETAMRLGALLMVNGAADKSLVNPEDRLKGTLNNLRIWQENLKKRGLT